MREARVPAFDLTEGGCLTWADVNKQTVKNRVEAHRRERRISGGCGSTSCSEIRLAGLVERHRRRSRVEKQGRCWLIVDVLELSRG
jgi:hypothetical protein